MAAKYIICPTGQSPNTYYNLAKCSDLSISQPDFLSSLPLIHLSSASHPHASPPGTANDPQIASHLSSRLFFSTPTTTVQCALCLHCNIFTCANLQESRMRSGKFAPHAVCNAQCNSEKCNTVCIEGDT